MVAEQVRKRKEKKKLELRFILVIREETETSQRLKSLQLCENCMENDFAALLNGT